MSVRARASPNASMQVVETLGATPRGQASVRGPMLKVMSLYWLRVESASWVMAMSRICRALTRLINRVISSVSPL